MMQKQNTFFSSLFRFICFKKAIAYQSSGDKPEYNGPKRKTED
jgi:hypothetical protein